MKLTVKISDCIDQLPFRYHSTDPVQSSYGEDAWNQQVQRAKEEIDQRVEEVINETITKLHNGGCALLSEIIP